MSRSGHGSSGGGGGIQFSEDQINEFQEAFLLYDNRYVGFYTSYVQYDCVLAGFFVTGFAASRATEFPKP